MFASTRFYFLIVFALAAMVFNHAQAADVRPAERGLVVLLNMFTGDKNMFMDEWYKMETASAAMAITGATKDHYGRRIILYRNNAKLSSLVGAIRQLNADPKIKAIDLIVYVHGKPSELNLIYEGLWQIQPLTAWYKIQDVATSVKAIGSNKLRAVYSDACYSQSHTDDWLNAGFKIAAGAIAMDGNQHRDLTLFLNHWTRGEAFRVALDHANSERTYRLLDRTLKDGNSFKALQGDQNARIDRF